MKIHIRPGIGFVRRVLVAMFVVGIFLLLTKTLHAQIIVGGPPPDKDTDARVQSAIIDSVSKALLDEYIFLDKAQAMSKHIRDQYKKGAYKIDHESPGVRPAHLLKTCSRSVTTCISGFDLWEMG